MKKCPAILDCTLRDGSYVVDFQFTKADTARLLARLGPLGFPYIEIGHGIGLGASAKSMGVAAATDIEYMEAGAESSYPWGMFAIPGIAKPADIELAAAHGMSFVRIGCEVADVDGARPYIELARRLGLYVFSNLMKSYAVPTAEFAAQAAKAHKWGAQCVYIVDSAGGMLPSTIRSYADALRETAPDIKLGFHGHNNLGLGVANALVAAEMGFAVIDTSLQGLGRSGGNVPVEQFLSVLKRGGYDVPYDIVDIMQAGEDVVRPMLRDAGLSSLDVTAGLAQFHSSYMPRILKVAKEKRVDPRRLILLVAEGDCLDAPMALIEGCADCLVWRGNRQPSAIVTKAYHGEEQT